MPLCILIRLFSSLAHFEKLPFMKSKQSQMVFIYSSRLMKPKSYFHLSYSESYNFCFRKHCKLFLCSLLNNNSGRWQIKLRFDHFKNFANPYSRFEPRTFRMKSCGATNLITMWLCMIRKWAVIRFSIHASTKPSLMIHQGCQHASWICGQNATVLDSAIVAQLLPTIPPPRNLSSV